MIKKYIICVVFLFLNFTIQSMDPNSCFDPYSNEEIYDECVCLKLKLLFQQIELKRIRNDLNQCSINNSNDTKIQDYHDINQTIDQLAQEARHDYVEILALENEIKKKG